MSRFLCLSIIFGLSVSVGCAGEASVADLLKKAGDAFEKGDTKEAVKLGSEAIRLDTDNPSGYWIRGQVYEESRNHEQAVRDFQKVTELAPKLAEPYQRLGSELFRLGKVKESVTAFNHYLKLKPERKVSHWQRGISFYYTGQFQEGKEQFEGYQSFDSNDVENAVWRYLCMVPLVGTKKARADLLKIGDDKRVPMRQIYDLFAGKLEPRDVLAAVEAGKPSKEQRNSRLFYAHLYLGLFYESEGDGKKALHHLEIATNHRIGHYMWDVAKVHRDLLQAKQK